MGRISGEATVAGGRSTIGQRFGDPMIEFNINVLGPPAQKNIPTSCAMSRGSLSTCSPTWRSIGEYDSDQPLNIGQNRWYGRLGMPIHLAARPVGAGRRTTLEFLPAVWFFGDNDTTSADVKTDPLFQLDAHLTRDLTEHFWGGSTVPGTTAANRASTELRGRSSTNLGLRATLGYQINDNLKPHFGYKRR